MHENYTKMKGKTSANRGPLLSLGSICCHFNSHFKQSYGKQSFCITKTEEMSLGYNSEITLKQQHQD